MFMSESSGFMGVASVKIAERESVKPFGTTPVNPVNQGQTVQHLCIVNTAHEQVVKIVLFHDACLRVVTC